MPDSSVRAVKATSLLKSDHQKVRELFRKYERREQPRSSKREVYESIHRLLVDHARIEEEIFYPAIGEAGNVDAGTLVAEAQEEHHVVKMLLDELEELQIGMPPFDAKMKVLSDNVEHHLEEEEEEIFPIFDMLDPEIQEDVSDRLRARKAELEAGD